MTKMRFVVAFVWSLYAGLTVAPLAGQAAGNLPGEVLNWAEVVFHNGKVITADPDFRIAQAVAVRNGKFLAVGDNARILAMAGPNTRVVDLNGRSMVPGFIDTHLHQAWVTQPRGEQAPANRPAPPMSSGQAFRTLEGALEYLRFQVSQAQPGEFLALSGPSNKVVIEELNAELLDQVSPNNPLYIEAINDQVVANSLVLARIPPDTPGVMKDANGKPTGQLRGWATGIPVYELSPWPDVEAVLPGQKQEFARLNELGLTMVMGRANGLNVSVFRELMLRDELTIRVRGAHEFLRQNGRPEAYLKRIGNLTGLGSGMFKIIGATVQVVDGAFTMGSAFTDIPKINRVEGDPYGDYGQNKWTEGTPVEQSDRTNIILGNRYGWTITGMHSSGDRSNTLILEAFKEANQEKPLLGRHFGLDHGEMLRESHFDMLKDMGVIPSMYTMSITNSQNYAYQYGPDAVWEMAPAKSLIRAGIKPAAEADTRPPQSYPLFQIRNWITRKDRDGKVWNPDERLTREEALYMYTAWAARYSGEEDILGSIEPGKLADLVILGGDYMTFPEDNLETLRVHMTMVDGKVVYEVPDAF